MKKTVSLLLALILALGVMPMALAANEESKLPVIYLYGKQDGNLIQSDGVSVPYTSQPLGMSRADYIKSILGPIFKELAIATVTDNWDNYIDTIADSLAPIYAPLILDGNGESVSGTKLNPKFNYRENDSAIINTSEGYIFRYDYRMSPMDVADDIDYFIERVLQKTGAQKVNVRARCIGSNFITAYLYKSYYGEYDHDFRVKNVILDTSLLGGYDLTSKLMSGKVRFNDELIDRYATYFVNDGKQLTSDSDLDEFLAVMVSVLDMAKVLGFGANVLNDVIDKVKEKAWPKVALICYGAYISSWSMVKDEDYEDAMNLIFNTDELREEYKVFIEKCDEYENKINKVQENGRTGYENLFRALENEGVKFAVFAKYGKPTLPMYEGCNITGDGRGTVTETSFGAVGLNYYEHFSDKYISQAKENGTYKYISPDLTVDGSTALFPDTTWYLKDAIHEDFPKEYTKLAMKFFESDGKLTVWDEDNPIPMFAKHGEDDSIVAVESGVNTAQENAWSTNPYHILIRFIISFFKLLVKLFTK